MVGCSLIFKNKFFVVLGIKPVALCMLGKHCSTELHPEPLLFIRCKSPFQSSSILLIILWGKKLLWLNLVFFFFNCKGNIYLQQKKPKKLEGSKQTVTFFLYSQMHHFCSSLLMFLVYQNTACSFHFVDVPCLLNQPLTGAHFGDFQL